VHLNEIYVCVILLKQLYQGESLVIVVIVIVVMIQLSMNLYHAGIGDLNPHTTWLPLDFRCGDV
jgi:disulfide bond formation protein DsbB